MATTTPPSNNNRNEIEKFIFRELKSINDEYDDPFTPQQVETIIKFIATDYDDRHIQIRADIAAQHVSDHVPRFIAYGYLNELLDKLGQNSPLSIIQNHVEFFTFLIRELQGYFDGANWLVQLESLVNEKFVKEFQATQEFVKEMFQDRLKSIEDQKKQILVELQVANALSNCPIQSEEEMSDDALIEYLVYSDVIKDVIKFAFEREMEGVQAMIREVQSDMKPALEFEARFRLSDLEFDIFSLSIIRKKVEKWSPVGKVASSLEGTSRNPFLLPSNQLIDLGKVGRRSTFGEVASWLEAKKNK